MISRLALTDFRSYADLFLDGLAPAVVITGANGAGKTNILEAVSMLSAGGPLRKASLDQLARIGGSGGWTVFARAGGNDIGVSFDGEKSIVANGGAATPGRLKDFARVVWMTPVQDRLFSEPGAERRRFLDGLISDFYSFYGDALGEYMGLLKSRAAILKMPRWDLAWLGATEAEIAARALSVAAMRLEFEERLNGQLDGIEISVSGLVEDALRKSKAAAVEDLYRENLRAGREDFKQSFSPPVDGVHRSDFSARDAAKGIDAALMSTGEQKLAVASIVLAYVRMIYLYFGSYPVILFDEAPAHLDRGRLLELERRLAAIPTQVWFTGTDAADFEFFKGGDARFIEL